MLSTDVQLDKTRQREWTSLDVRLICLDDTCPWSSGWTSSRLSTTCQETS